MRNPGKWLEVWFDPDGENWVFQNGTDDATYMTVGGPGDSAQLAWMLLDTVLNDWMTVRDGFGGSFTVEGGSLTGSWGDGPLERDTCHHTDGWGADPDSPERDSWTCNGCDRTWKEIHKDAVREVSP